MREAKFDPLQKEKPSLKTDTAIVFKISLPLINKSVLHKLGMPLFTNPAVFLTLLKLGRGGRGGSNPCKIKNIAKGTTDPSVEFWSPFTKVTS